MFGRLESYVAIRLIDMLSKLTDIGEKESEILHDLLQGISDIQDCYPDQSRQLIPDKYKQNIENFQLCRQILNWGLPEIMDSYRLGVFASLPNHMLAHLIQALFADSAYRQQCLLDTNEEISPINAHALNNNAK